MRVIVKRQVQTQSLAHIPHFESHIMKNIDHLINRQRTGHFVAYHPITKVKIGTFESWIDAFNTIQSILKETL